MWAFKRHTVLVEILFDLIGACFGLDLIWREKRVFLFYPQPHINAQLFGATQWCQHCLCFWQKFLLLDELSKNQSSVIRSELRPKPEDCSVTIDNLTAKWNPVGIGMCLYSDTPQSVVGVRGCMFVHEWCRHVCRSIRVLCVCVFVGLSMGGYQRVAVRVLWVSVVVCLSRSGWWVGGGWQMCWACVYVCVGMCSCIQVLVEIK